ncbi:MAG: SMC-Scp complex subunit ScpB [Candidatus Marinimicrobia bacterium]|jgi:segregation and condensation protein B|nr:SMC-Scp complex subunit ScpB [Candidatus Neomarinimicrobiota bacterium]MBT3847944.1 SMC-Scp complex subunit ScpB [Candidatus Neomarinimicrobiota bacterium]MBT4662756.1 SMC-Scp complex subunit ScpB [Candidatus Neomarinimicrobiota bacterium]MBT4828515.1 SMC-Scp complex subunit ScpB [Candidatus Neomarinimicrobiota bacterium]MBT5225382.1 SMC-Scp complex subunit ScpB [Candidatus Neomarinimicrobiota bacterium]
MQDSEIRKIIEALLFASPEPLTQAKVNGIFNPDTPNLKEVVLKLNEQYVHDDHAFEINEVAGGYQLVSRQEYEHFIRKMLSKSGRISLSSAALDSLAIIAYKQPIGRYEVEAIRGVDSSGVLKTLLNRNLIKIKGRDSGPGRPLLYQTTNKFLEHFGLNRLSDMPKLKEITELMEADPTLGEQIVVFEENEPDDTNIDSPGPEATAG